MDVYRTRDGRGENIPTDVVRSIQSAFNDYNRDSEVWRNKGANPKHALFFCPKGNGAGVWAVDPERAKEWLAERTFSSDIRLAGDGEDLEF